MADTVQPVARPTTCQHVFTRGDKKKAVCNTRLCGAKAKDALRCSMHNPERMEQAAVASKLRKDARESNLYKVTIDNPEENKVFKKAPSGPVTRLVGEQRAADLKKKGGQVEVVVNTEANRYDDLLKAYKALSKDYQELAAEYEDLLSQGDNIGAPVK